MEKGKREQMIYSINFDGQEEELNRLEHTMHDEAAFAGDDEWKWLFTSDFKKVLAAEDAFPVLDISCLDITGKGGTKRAEEVRSRYRESAIMIIADSKMSPLEYLKPSIQASSLLLRPVTEEMMKKTIHDFIHAFTDAKAGGTGTEYVVETREGKTFLPINKIAYFEARQKKIYIRVGAREYDTYDTIDRLAEKLPDQFMRSHRSFIVNRKMIDYIRLSENSIFLRDGSVIPLSRSYRSAFKSLQGRVY